MTACHVHFRCYICSVLPMRHKLVSTLPLCDNFSFAVLDLSDISLHALVCFLASACDLEPNALN